MPGPKPKPMEHGRYYSYVHHKCRCADCKTAANLYRAQYRNKNKVKVQTQQKKFYATHPEYTNQWRASNKERMKGYWSARRLKTKVSKEEREVSLEYRKAIKNDCCFYCTEISSTMHDDHYFPIAKGGGEYWYNLVRSCSSCNLVKNARCGTKFKLLNSNRKMA